MFKLYFPETGEMVQFQSARSALEHMTNINIHCVLLEYDVPILSRDPDRHQLWQGYGAYLQQNLKVKGA